FALHALAQHQFSTHLRTQAAHALALAARGETPYRWHFRDAEDVVAGRVFGAAGTEFQHGALHVRAGDAAFEIGLPLPRPVDLSLFPQVAIVATRDAPAATAGLGRDSLLAPQLELARGALAPDANSLSLPLAALISAAPGGAAAPPHTAMLRLRVSLPPGHAL